MLFLTALVFVQFVDMVQDFTLSERLHVLVREVQRVPEPQFEYDVNYCTRNLLWIHSNLRVRARHTHPALNLVSSCVCGCVALQSSPARVEAAARKKAAQHAREMAVSDTTPGPGAPPGMAMLTHVLVPCLRVFAGGDESVDHT